MSHKGLTSDTILIIIRHPEKGEEANGKAVSDRLAEVVCATPGSIPRMMAHTVAMFSDKDWSIFKSLTEAVEYINTRGFTLTGQELAGPGTVIVKSR